MTNRRAEEPEAEHPLDFQQLASAFDKVVCRPEHPEQVVFKGLLFTRRGKVLDMETGEPAPPAVVAAVLEDFARQRAWVDPPRGD